MQVQVHVVPECVSQRIDAVISREGAGLLLSFPQSLLRAVLILLNSPPSLVLAVFQMATPPTTTNSTDSQPAPLRYTMMRNRAKMERTKRMSVVCAVEDVRVTWVKRGMCHGSLVDEDCDCDEEASGSIGSSSMVFA